MSRDQRWKWKDGWAKLPGYGATRVERLREVGEAEGGTWLEMREGVLGWLRVDGVPVTSSVKV